MIIYTYDSNENLTGSFDLINAVPLSFVHSEHNGMLDMSFLGANDSISEGGFVGFEDIDGNYQMFEVVQSTQTHSEKGLIYEYSCEHIYYELLSEVIDDRESYEQLPMEAALRVLQDTRWTLGRYFTADQISFSFRCQSVLSAITKIADSFGCRVRYRLSHQNGEITGRFIDLLQIEQNITGKQFIWGKDIMSLTRKIDTRDVYTALYGQGKSVNVADSDSSGEQYERIDFSRVQWQTPNDPVDKPFGRLYVADEQALQKYGRGKPGEKHHRYGVAVFDSISDEEELLTATWELLQTVNKPKVSYSIKALDLATLCGYKYEAFHIGDTVSVIDQAFSPELETFITITRIDRDYLYPENTEITLGSQLSDMSDILRKLSQSQAKLRNKEGVFDTVVDPNSPIDTSRLQGAIDAFVNYIVCSDDYQAGKPNPETGILLENTNPQSASYGALYLGPGIFSIANTQVDGLWQWRTFGNGSGFVADCVNTGVLLADLIKTGMLQSFNGKSYINMDDGSFSLGEGAVVFDGNNTTKFTGDIEITSGSRRLYIRPDELGQPLIGFQMNNSDVGYIYAKNSETLTVASNYQLVLSAATGVKLSSGPFVLPNGESGYTGSFSAGSHTLYFNNGVLYKVS